MTPGIPPSPSFNRVAAAFANCKRVSALPSRLRSTSSPTSSPASSAASAISSTWKPRMSSRCAMVRASLRNCPSSFCVRCTCCAFSATCPRKVNRPPYRSSRCRCVRGRKRFKCSALAVNIDEQGGRFAQQLPRNRAPVYAADVAAAAAHFPAEDERFRRVGVVQSFGFHQGPEGAPDGARTGRGQARPSASRRPAGKPRRSPPALRQPAPYPPSLCRPITAQWRR